MKDKQPETSTAMDYVSPYNLRMYTDREECFTKLKLFFHFVCLDVTRMLQKEEKKISIHLFVNILVSLIFWCRR